MSLSNKALAFALFITAASAQWWWPGSDSGGTGADNDPRVFFDGTGNSGGTTAGYYPYGFASFDTSKNYRRAAHARIAHAALASAAFVFFFPVGAIAVRILPGRLALVVHALCQLFAWLIFTIAFILGIWIALYVSSSDFKLIRLYHPIIGIVIYCLLFFQPLTGFLHHRGFRKYGTRTGVSYLHISFGRMLITFGMINGGLGLMLAANATKGEIIAYGIIAGLMWLLWMGVALFSEARRARRPVNVDGTKGGVLEREGANGVKGANGTNGTHHTDDISAATDKETGGVADAPREPEKYA